jgi:hypothetical protein
MTQYVQAIPAASTRGYRAPLYAFPSLLSPATIAPLLLLIRLMTDKQDFGKTIEEVIYSVGENGGFAETGLPVCGSLGNP